MSPNSRRPISRRLFLNGCLLLGLLLAGLTGLTSRKVGAVFVAPRLRESTKALSPVAVPTGATERTIEAQLREAYGKLPISFEANQGQTDRAVKFVSRGGGYSLFLTPTAAVLRLETAERRSGNEPKEASVANPGKARNLKSSVVRMNFAGANPEPHVSGIDQLPGKSNYFIGNNPAKWRTGVSSYAKVKYEGIYPGVDLVMYGNQRQLEYDFVVAPGADPNSIRLAFEGVRQMRLDARGELVLSTRGGEVRHQKPVIYQEVNGSRRIIDGHYIIKGRKQIGFQIANYDASLPLVIDPTVALVYGAFIGGSGIEIAQSLAIDVAGNAYVTGNTSSLNFPTTPAAVQSTNADGGVFYDVFVSKLSADGTTLLYSTYLGGNQGDDGLGIALDVLNNIYVCGQTGSTDFPVTAGAYQPTHVPGTEGFVVKLNPSALGAAQLVYSTYLGGSNNESAEGIAVDAAGVVYVAGETTSTNFPVLNAFQSSLSGFFADAFFVKLNPAGTGAADLLYSTYLGGSSLDGGARVAVDLTGNAYVAGATSSTNFPVTPGAFQTAYTGFGDGFITKINPNATGAASLLYSTYLGGNANDQVFGLALDALGDVYVTGHAQSLDFPSTPDAVQTTNHGGFISGSPKMDAFITRLRPAGNGAADLIYSTFLGGFNAFDEGIGIAVDVTGKIYVVGATSSSDFPITTCGDHTFHEGPWVAKIDPSIPGPTGLIYSTFFSGSTGPDRGTSIVVDATGSAYVAGGAYSADFPSTPGAYHAPNTGGNQAFIAKLDPSLCNDACPDDPNKTAPGVCGCGVPDTDTDGDGTPDCNDACPSDPNKIAEGVCGCGVAETDTDGDGTPDCNDACPTDPNKIAPGVCGCGTPDTDTDGDGTPNCNDACPNDPNKIAAGQCGCGVPDTDTDGDGTANCIDACPSDPNKIAPGVCGCGVPDTDTDSDGIPNCIDACPTDPNKAAPGVCGCGVPDTDSDGDGIPNCHDNCPNTANPDQRDTNGDGVGDACTPFQFPGAGQFVIGDLANLSGGVTVYFWGSQWSQNNPMSGGSGPNAFKGFENGTAAPECNGTWTSQPGNSSNPPSTIPQYMAVIVSSSIQKNGSVISGDIKKIIIVKTNPGYGPSPGHAGTGQVVAILCGPGQLASLFPGLRNSAESVKFQQGLKWLSDGGRENWSSGPFSNTAFRLSL